MFLSLAIFLWIVVGGAVAFGGMVAARDAHRSGEGSEARPYGGPPR